MSWIARHFNPPMNRRIPMGDSPALPMPKELVLTLSGLAGAVAYIGTLSVAAVVAVAVLTYATIRAPHYLNRNRRMAGRTAG